MYRRYTIYIKSLKEPWLDTTTPQGRLLFTIFSGVSQFERELIIERTRAGLKAARARGRKGGLVSVLSRKTGAVVKRFFQSV